MILDDNRSHASPDSAVEQHDEPSSLTSPFVPTLFFTLCFDTSSSNRSHINVTSSSRYDVEQMNVLIHCYMDRSSALLEGEVCYIEVSVVRKGVTQQAAQGCSRQQQPIGGLDILYLNI